MVFAFFFFSSETLLRGIGMGLDIVNARVTLVAFAVVSIWWFQFFLNKINPSVGFKFFFCVLELTKLGHVLHILQIFNVAVLQCVTDVVTCIRRILMSKTQI